MYNGYSKLSIRVGTPLWVDKTDPEETWATFWTKYGFNDFAKEISPPATYLGIRIVEVVLCIGIIEVLLERHGGFLSTSANDDCFNVQRALGLDRDVDVCSTDAGQCLRHCIRLDIVGCNTTSCRFPRRIRNDLEQPRNVPVLVQRMIRLRRGHVKSNIVRKAISKGGCKRCQVQEVGRKVERAV